MILLALAPELDRRYERLYAYLQNHINRIRPSIDLALNLLCPDAGSRIEQRIYFDPQASLIKYHLVHLIPEPNQIDSTLLAHSIKLDDQITRFLLHQDDFDARLDPFCHLDFSPTKLDELYLDKKLKKTLHNMVSVNGNWEQPLRLYFHGAIGIGKKQTACAFALEHGKPLLIVDIGKALKSQVDFAHILQLVFRYAWFYSTFLYLENLDILRNEEYSMQHQQLLEALVQDSGITILAGTQQWNPVWREPIDIIEIPFVVPNFEQRRKCWINNLSIVDVSLDEDELDILASRFPLKPNQIIEAINMTLNKFYWQKSNQAKNTEIFPELLKSIRNQSSSELDTLTQKVESLYCWNDIVLPDDGLTQLRELCQRVAYHEQVFSKWGFEYKLSRGKGCSALFTGPSGTGKTMAAEIVANELSLDLYRIDLSSVVSKYIGETEKNLSRIFSAAKQANAILFFDEADALFGKRSEVQDAHDRYANIEISYLLQKMEEYDGLAILATNLRQNLDSAFTRRLAFTILFPFPDEIKRCLIWENIWPDKAPLAKDVDTALLAKRFKLSGGNIKNVALAASFYAAQARDEITMSHLLQAVRREYQKMGKYLSEAELFGDEVAI